MVPQSVLTQELVHRICREYRIMSCDLIVREDATVDQLIDVIEVLYLNDWPLIISNRGTEDIFLPFMC